MPTLIDQSIQQLTPQMLTRLGMMTGEKQPALQNAVNVIFPMLLSAINREAGAPEGAEQVLNAVAAVEPLGDPLGRLQGGEPTRELLQRGAALAQSLFGGSTTAVAQAVSLAGGVSSSSAANLLAVLTPLVLATIGRQLSGAGLFSAEDRAGGLAQVLAGQELASRVVEAVDQPVPEAPPSVIVPAAAATVAASTPIERAAVAAAAATAAPAVPPPARSAPKPAPAPVPERKPAAPPPEPPKRSFWRWLLPLLLIAIVAGLAWYFFRPQPVIAPAAPAGATPAAATATATPAAATEAAPAAATEELTATVEAAEPATSAATEEAATEAATTEAATAEATPTVPVQAPAATTAAATESATEAAATATAAPATPTAAPTATAAPATPTTAATAAAAAPPATFTGENAAVCTAIAAAQAALDAAPPITAQTSRADLQSLLGELRTSTQAVTDAAAGRSDIDLAAVNAGLDVLDIAVSAVPGDIVGSLAPTVSSAVRGVSSAYNALNTAVSCGG